MNLNIAVLFLCHFRVHALSSVLTPPPLPLPPHPAQSRRGTMPRVSRATTAAPAPKRKAASVPAAASPSKRATSSNRQQPAPARAAARCVAELNPHGAEFNASGLGSHFVGSSAPRQRAAVCYDIDPFRSRRAPRGEGRAAAPARSKQPTVPKRSKVGGGLSRTDRRMIPTRPAPARPAAPRPEAAPPAGSPGVGQRVEVYWQGRSTNPNPNPYPSPSPSPNPSPNPNQQDVACRRREGGRAASWRRVLRGAVRHGR